MDGAADSYQSRFAARWGHLANPHVRALAWLLDAPDLLDVHDPYWAGKIATLGPPAPATVDWLNRLDADPAPLLAALSTRNYTRLGLYAEKLMAFYYAAQGVLVTHGLQVRASRNDTVGEFDFLLDAGPDGVEHIEFATKLYLLQGESAQRFDTFVGPNLADTLGKKMRKVVERQLTLGEHPAAQGLLPRPVVRARALVKGWLFYPGGHWHRRDDALGGISPLHCRGFWCALGDIGTIPGERFVILPRLQWLAPYRAAADGEGDVYDKQRLAERLEAQFAELPSPVLVAAVEERDGVLREAARGFIVPDDWTARAAQRRQSGASP